LVISDFAQKFNRMWTNVLAYAVQKCTAKFAVFYFYRNSKDVEGDPIYRHRALICYPIQ